MSKISVLETPAPIAPGGIAGKVAVVIDVLRATSSITTAISSGCRSVIPASSKDDALRLKASYPDALLGGEICGKTIEGFDLGNSPADYGPKTVKGKDIIMSTSNGTKAILGAVRGGASEVLICSFLNLRAVAKEVAEQMTKGEKDAFIVCSGSLGEFSLEDFACAGALVKEVLALAKDKEPSRDDTAATALQTFERYAGNLMAVFQDSPHGRDLMDIGFASDLELCAKISSIDVVPKVHGDTAVVSLMR